MISAGDRILIRHDLGRKEFAQRWPGVAPEMADFARKYVTVDCVHEDWFYICETGVSYLWAEWMIEDGSCDMK